LLEERHKELNYYMVLTENVKKNIMKTELQHAVTFLVETLKDRLPKVSENNLDTLRTRLTDLLAERYENHWYVDKPLKGSAFRCINISVEDNTVDATFRKAYGEVGITDDDVFGIFCNGLALWVDPDDVSGRMGKGSIFPIYKKMSTSNRTVVPEQPKPTSGVRHRPQQRPRSISPPQSSLSVMSTPDFQPSSKPITTTVSRPSKTPPGFRSLDAGQNFYSMPNQHQHQPQPQQNQNVTVRQSQQSDFPNNIQNLWRSQTTTAANTTMAQQGSHMNTPRHSSSSYLPSQSNNKYNSNSGGGDAVYSFNQYSSYYNPYFHWKKDAPSQTQTQYSGANASVQNNIKSMWQDDESYQRTHCFRGEVNKNSNSKLSVAGNNLTFNKMQNYAYGLSRQAQEVY
jgi:protein Tob/BTG